MNSLLISLFITPKEKWAQLKLCQKKILLLINPYRYRASTTFVFLAFSVMAITEDVYQLYAADCII